MALSGRYARHGGIILAIQLSWSMKDLIAALDHLLAETEVKDWVGQVCWLNIWAASQ